MAAVDKYNLKNPAVKRILQEVKEMQSNPSDDFMSLPLEENIFEWQFAIRGPRDTEFEGGIYHGRIQLPAEYPFKPPSFMLLTPNGRFETQTKICLSISNHHPEHWQPSWSVRTALVALIAFMPTPPNGALGSLDYKKEERRGLAIKSREAPPKYGSPERQNLIDEIHTYMLSKSPPVPESLELAPEEHSAGNEAEAEGGENAGNSSNTREPTNVRDDRIEEPQAAAQNASPPVILREVRQVRVGISLQVRHRQQSPPRAQRPLPDGIISIQAQRQPAQRPPDGIISIQARHRRAPRAQRPADDRLFTWAAVGLTVAIVFLLLKKLMKSTGYGAFFMSEL